MDTQNSKRHHMYKYVFNETLTFFDQDYKSNVNKYSTSKTWLPPGCHLVLEKVLEYCHSMEIRYETAA